MTIQIQNQNIQNIKGFLVVFSLLFLLGCSDSMTLEERSPFSGEQELDPSYAIPYSNPPNEVPHVEGPTGPPPGDN